MSAESWLPPLLLSVLLGGAIGLEREWSGRPAGLRTHILVCLCSTVLILVSRSAVPSTAGTAATIVFDPNRMGAGIVTGIGFLGAATVVRSGDILRGLTTAACIWYVAGLGIALGTGHVLLPASATGIVLLVLTLVNRLAGRIKPVNYRRLVVFARANGIEELVAAIRAELERGGMTVLDIASGHDNELANCELEFHLRLKNEFQAPALTERIARLPEVLNARWKPMTDE